MTSHLEKLKKLRSWDEFRTRGSQAMAAYGEKIGFTGRVPTDEEFVSLIVDSKLKTTAITPENLRESFQDNADLHFFSVFREPAKSALFFNSSFAGAAKGVFNSAERLIAGRIELLGHNDILIGPDVDWHLEPISQIRSPLKHWKEFDDLDVSESGDKKVIWELNRHQHFFTLGAAFFLTGDERFSDLFVRHVESWMDQNPPGTGVNWSSSLEISFRAISWIWAFRLFQGSERFSPAVFAKCVKFLYLHGRHIERYLSKYYSPNTHLTGEALGLYYLGTQLPFLERASHWKKIGEQIMHEEVKRQLLEDGVYFEQSTWYQRYTVSFYLQFLILQSLNRENLNGLTAATLENRLSSALEFLSTKLRSRIGSALDFMMCTARPDGTSPLIGDDDGGTALPITSARANDFRDTIAIGALLMERGDLKYASTGCLEGVFWLFGPDGVNCLNEIPEQVPEKASRSFPVGGYYVMRDGWLDTDSFLVVDCGPVGSLSGGHGHADSLSIEVALRGKQVLIDPGTYSYNSARAARDHFRSTTAHNTLTVDGRSSSEPGGTFSWKTRAECSVSKWIAQDRFDYFEGQHNGYQRLASPVIHERSILFLKNDYVVIRDLAIASGDHEYSLNYQFPADRVVHIDETGGFAESYDCRIFVFGDDGNLQLEQSLISTRYGSTMEASKLSYSSTGRASQEFFSFILPRADGQEEPFVREVPFEGGRAFSITFEGYKDLIIYGDSRMKLVKTELFESNFKLNWSRVGSLIDRPEEYVLIQGSSFSVCGSKVINTDSQADSVSVRQIGQEFYVKRDLERFIV